MPLQRSVAQQNNETLDAIRRTASAFAARMPRHAWLARLLAEHGLNPEEGLLVQFGSIPEQAGDECFGTWLSSSGQFWTFSAIVCRRTGAVLDVEPMENVTASVVVSAHVPGTGRSFGYLALQVLGASLGGRPRPVEAGLSRTD